MRRFNVQRQSSVDFGPRGGRETTAVLFSSSPPDGDRAPSGPPCWPTLGVEARRRGRGRQAKERAGSAMSEDTAQLRQPSKLRQLAEDLDDVDRRLRSAIDARRSADSQLQNAEEAVSSAEAARKAAIEQQATIPELGRFGHGVERAELARERAAAALKTATEVASSVEAERRSLEQNIQQARKRARSLVAAIPVKRRKVAWLRSGMREREHAVETMRDTISREEQAIEALEQELASLVGENAEATAG